MALLIKENFHSVSHTIRSLLSKNNAIILSCIGTGVGFGLLRWYFSGAKCRCTKQLTGKTVIVTGSNKGIGRETARDFAKRGARVILAVRDITKGERAAEDIRQSTGNNNVIVRIVDLSSLESVRKFCRHILEKEERLDILVNNAGVRFCPHWTSQEGYELHFAVNHLGHFLLTNLLVNLMKKSAPSRIICVTCMAYEEGSINFDDLNSQRSYDPWTAYTQSKLANILFSQELSNRLTGSGVTVNSVHPGIVQSELGRYTGDNKPALWRRLLIKIVGFIIMKTPQQGAQTSIYCAVSDKIENVSGKYFSDCCIRETSSVAKDKVTSTQLWDISCKRVNLHLPPT
ncbi:retinol dehydrogenase 11 isoform X1 [Patella vulgata]|uniref:retinol dehydrogenase 11 isoform X1 n=1 Tax=Patella vulgata TaxID=6465 RepID=UPI0021802278|nr:retinol dehydrogenase 11 isoform X1 [Patella vulgata]